MGLITEFKTREEEKPGAIRPGATNLTIVSTVLAVIGVAATSFNESFQLIFGDGASQGVKAAVLIAVIAAWAIIVAADVLARAHVAAAAERATHLFDAPLGLGARVDGKPAKTVEKIRFDGQSGATEFELRLGDDEKRWYPEKDVVLTKGPDD